MKIDLLKFTVKKDCGPAAEQLMKTHITATRGEEGCEYAHLFESSENPSEFYMLLSWASQEAVDKHLQLPRDAEFRAALDNILERPPEFINLQA